MPGRTPPPHPRKQEHKSITYAPFAKSSVSLEKAKGRTCTWVPTMHEHLRFTPNPTNEPDSVRAGRGPSLAKATANVQGPQAEPGPPRQREGRGGASGKRPRKGWWSPTEGSGHAKVQGARSTDRPEGISETEELKKDVRMGMSSDRKGARLGLTWFLRR